MYSGFRESHFITLLIFIVPQIIEQEKEFMNMYTLDKLSRSDNPIARLTMMALKAIRINLCAS